MAKTVAAPFTQPDLFVSLPRPKILEAFAEILAWAGREIQFPAQFCQRRKVNIFISAVWNAVNVEAFEANLQPSEWGVRGMIRDERVPRHKTSGVRVLWVLGSDGGDKIFDLPRRKENPVLICYCPT